MREHEKSRRSLLEAAYCLLINGYDTIKISKQEFDEEVSKAKPKFNMIEKIKLPDKTNGELAESFGGWNDLKCILNECVDIVDDGSVSQFKRGAHIFDLNVTTESCDINITKDWLGNTEKLRVHKK